ncbi:MAG: hypothetical protein J0M11_09750 [Anaerolineae bacterium]|nr:hypothetical protein [Anaerolineae bacterium]
MLTKKKFSIEFPNEKTLTFSDETKGIIVNGIEYLAEGDGVLVYDQVKKIFSNKVVCQYSTNTSTLIPAFRILNIAYHPYFDIREVVESQNRITFYWNKSKLAAYYNRFGTDKIDLDRRRDVISTAVSFLAETATSSLDFLPDELLNEIKDPCKFIGFYNGFPVFDATKGFPALLSRIGIHIGIATVMISTPIEKYNEDVYELGKILEQRLNIRANYKKNRVVFDKSEAIINEILSNEFSNPNLENPTIG